MPAFQGGTLITILFFIFMQDVVLGFAAIALYPVQMWLIPKLQRQVNNLGKRRVRQVRRNAERISETASGVRDIRANDATAYELTRFTKELGEVFWIRFDIYKKKFLIKFLNNFIAQLGPFFFFTIGGYLVIHGEITLGALVAIVGAHKDLSSPWKELLTYYQTMYDVKIKYEQTVTQFAPPGLIDQRRQSDDPPENLDLQAPLRAQNLAIAEEGEEPIVEGLSFELPLPTRLAITGPAGSGKEELTLVLAGLLQPHAGRVLIGETDIASLPESVLGRRFGYVGTPSYIFSGTLEENLLFGLRHRPVVVPELSGEQEASRKRELHEAKRSGNARYDPEADWTDWAAAGVNDPSERLPVMVQALQVATLEGDVYVLGLRGTVTERHGDLPDRLLEARRAMQERLGANKQLARLVEHFHPDRYNTNATLAENLLFGVPVDDRFNVDHLATNPYVRRDAGCDRADPGADRGRLQRGPDHAGAVRRPAAGPRVFPPVQLHRPGRAAGLPGAGGAGRSEPPGCAVGRRPRAPADDALQADPGPASARTAHARAAGQGPGGSTALPGEPAGAPARCDRLLRPRCL